MIHQCIVEIVATQVGIAALVDNTSNIPLEMQDGNIEGAAAQVVNGDGLFCLCAIQTIGQARSRWLVDDAQYIQPSQFPRIAGGPRLRR